MPEFLACVEKKKPGDLYNDLNRKLSIDANQLDQEL